MEYIRREFHEFGANDIYLDDGLYYILPIQSLKEIDRLSKLKLTESQEKELSVKLNKMDGQLKTILQN